MAGLAVATDYIASEADYIEADCIASEADHTEADCIASVADYFEVDCIASDSEAGYIVPEIEELVATEEVD